MSRIPMPAARRPLVLALAAGLLVISAPEVAPTPAHETLAQIIARWRAHVAPLRDVPRDVRVPESKRFFLTIPWENIESLCLEGSAGVGPDSAALLQYVVRYRLEVGPPAAASMAAMVESPNYALPCKGPILAWVHNHRDSLGAADRRLLADGYLRGASYPVPAPLRGRLLTGAVALVAGDSLMAMMMASALSKDEAEARLGVRMLAASVDPRAPDTLALLARACRLARSPVFEEALLHCRGRCGELALDDFIAGFQDPFTAEGELLALEAAARVPRLEAAKAILDFYRDGGVIADSTFSAAGEERARYYRLWIATRVAEPHLVAWLSGGGDEESRVALELLDRALRFGPMDEDRAVLAALEAYAGRAPEALAGRALAVRERAEDPPQSRPREARGPVPEPSGGPQGPGDPVEGDR